MPKKVKKVKHQGSDDTIRHWLRSILGGECRCRKKRKRKCIQYINTVVVYAIVIPVCVFIVLSMHDDAHKEFVIKLSDFSVKYVEGYEQPTISEEADY